MELSIIETGAQLLARLTKRPSLDGLEKVLFANGPRQNEVVEISGDSSGGKTLLTTQLLLKCLLPKTYKDFETNGLGAGAVLVNTDHHFQISMLVKLMKSSLRNVKTGKGSKTEILKDEIMTTIIEDSLSSLTVINCYNSAQFLLGLHALQTILSNDDKIALVTVDSVSSYYWEDRETGAAWSMDAYLKSCLKLMQKFTLHHKVVLLYTRPTEFESRGREAADCAAAPEEERVNYRIQLQRSEKTGKFSAVVQSATDKRNISYTVTDDGIAWGNRE